MKLFLWRHGIAEDSNPEGDSQRDLTKEGVLKVRKMAEYLAGTFEPDLILSSPYLRAWKTAEIVRASLQKAKPQSDLPEIQESPYLLPSSDLDNIFVELNSSACEQPLLIGHNPYLEHLISSAISGGDADISLKKSAVCRIDFNGKPSPDAGTIIWLITPGILKDT
ncbi:MAG: histidine phosphatase family protein [Spirochaetales bacterium]|nr:histidine phosphatase family protein [Spirochaetales bacterium]MCF7939366.1 histidine phosphatase family protein [Spirochaetales bacterium]